MKNESPSSSQLPAADVQPGISRRTFVAGSLSTVLLGGCALVRKAIFGSPKPAEVRRGEFYELEFYPESDNSAEIAQSLNLVYLLVVHNGQLQQLVLKEEDLKKNPNIKLDGYMASMMVFGTKDMAVTFGDTSVVPLGSDNNEAIRLIYTQSNGFSFVTTLEKFRLVNDELPESELNALFFEGQAAEDGVEEIFPGRFVILGGEKYPFGLDSYMGRPLTESSEETLRLQMGSERYEIKIEQKSTVSIANIEGLNFNYLGNDIERLKQVPDVNHKIEAISQGVRAVEQKLSCSLIDSVVIVDYLNNNASEDGRARRIWFSIDRLSQDSAENLKIIAEHELLHVFSENKKYGESKGIRSVYAELMGFNEARTQEMVRKGRVLWQGMGMDSMPAPFKYYLDFISESGFLSDFVHDGGHSQSDLSEYLASFLHSLMYINLLPKNLKNPSLTVEQRAATYSFYRATLSHLLAHAKAIGDDKGAQFFEEKLQYVDTIVIDR